MPRLSRRRTLSARLAGWTTLASVLATSCSLLGARPEEPPSRGPLEKASLTIAVLPTVELAPLQLAMKSGYFAAEGLSVQLVIASNGPAALAGIASGDFDIAYSSYVPFIVATAKGAIDVRVVTDNSFAAPNTAMLMVAPGSSIRVVQDIAGKRIAVPGRSTSADLLVKSTLETNNVDYSAVRWVELPFPDMTAALERGDIDAAMLVEPFVTQAEKQIGAMPFLDLAAGPLHEFPFTAYGATRAFVDQHPHTIAAFQRVMRRASDEAVDRTKIEPLLPEITKIDASTAALVTLPGFRSTLDAKRIQRVADLMLEFGVLDQPFDVAPMLLPPPAPAALPTAGTAARPT